ncbi:hypothetical protein G6F59_014224 [Rhizopus arrhizus]|nr:hypothetical protein G6F59_014224 [Rhizopus arrhizus]
MRRAQQRAEAVRAPRRHPVGGSQHDQRPQHLLGQEGAECHIPRQQAGQAQDQHGPHRAQHQRNPEGRRRVVFLDAQAAQPAADGQHDGHRGHDDHGDAAGQRDGCRQAGVQQYRQALGQPDHHDQRAQQIGQPVQARRHGIADGRQAPGRAVRRQQRVAQTRDIATETDGRHQRGQQRPGVVGQLRIPIQAGMDQ